ncbi:MAG TPA: helix-turn-helix domain-containing protein [Bacteroidales bacterium]|nr:helix-turn-helix domain-containing protein [Bacteroidales bacterium]
MEVFTEGSEATIASRFINGTNRHVFLTGKAGTGKTTFLKEIIHRTFKNTIVAAPTGIAAINAGGVTLHSLFQLPFGTFLPSDDIRYQDGASLPLSSPRTLTRSLQLNTTKRKMLRELELLIIDEVSMLRADILDAIDVTLRSVRRNSQPFGGIQILFIGDLLQLPPVVKHAEWEYLNQFYESIYFFEAKALKQSPPVYVELGKIYRQSDATFINILNHLRDNHITPEDIEVLNRYCDPGVQPEENKGYVYLTTHNKRADEINSRALAKLKGKSFKFKAEVTGDFTENIYPVEYTLELKPGAQVMFVKNDYSGEQRYFNGKIGTVTGLSDEDIEVSFDDGSDPAEVEKYTWENKRYTLNKETNEIEEKIMGTFVHYPIKLAWAITVHKSQGLTFEKAIIDVSRAFAPGQIYVALSRLVSLDGLILTAPIPATALGPDASLVNFTNSKPTAENLEKDFKTSTVLFVRDTVINAFDFGSLLAQFSVHVASYNKDEKKSSKQQYHKWAKKLLSGMGPLKQVGGRFQDQVKHIVATEGEDGLPRLYQRVKAAIGYFEPLLKDLAEKVNKHDQEIKNQSGTVKYRRELQEVEALFTSQLKTLFKAEALVAAALNQKELSKADYYQALEGKELMKVSFNKSSKNLPDKKVKLSRKAKKEQDSGEKIPSREISYGYYKDGKTIEEIAKERQLAESTIEGHLSYYVARGEIPAVTFVDEYKIKPILEVSRKLETNKLGEIKNALGDEFTYSDLRFVMAAKMLEEKEAGSRKLEG